MKKAGVFAVAWIAMAIGYFLHGAVDFVTQPDGKIKLCALPTPIYDAEMVIYTDAFQEISQALYYQVHAGGQVRVPMAYFGGTEIGELVTKDSFTVLGREGSDLVGVAFASDPKAILILHNFSTGETWPKAGYTEHFSSTHDRGKRLLDRLRQESEIPDLQLGAGGGTDSDG